MEKFIHDILKKLTTEEKIELLSGCDTLSVGKLPRLNIREVFMVDGPQGVRLDNGNTTTALPCGISLAASWDTALAEKFGSVIGEEARACGIRASLGPGINLMRTPLNGRTFEYYGEDPVLAGKIAAGYVRGCQAKGVAACPKHLALNNQEICRTTGDSLCSEDVLRDLYLENFEIVLSESSPHMIMSSYNKINGTQASECTFTQKKFLRDEMNFDGVVVSDWGGTQDIKKALIGGQDLEMGGGPHTLSRTVLPALIANGEISMEVIDNAVLNNLRLLYRMGAFEEKEDTANFKVNSPESQAFVRYCACEGAVLLKNEDKMLPLDFSKYKKVAVIGPSADFRHHMLHSVLLGGGSGAVHPPYEVSVLEALQKRFGNECEFVFERGICCELEQMIDPEMIGEGFTGEYFADQEAMKNNAAPLLTRMEKTMNINSGVMNFGGSSDTDDILKGTFAARFHGFITPAKSGKLGIQPGMSGIVGKMFINGENVCSNKDFCHYIPIIEIDAVANEPIEITIEILHQSHRSANLILRCFEDESENIARALRAASESDLVIYVGGSNHCYDKEAIGWADVPGADIPSTDLPYEQADFIRKLAQVNPNTAVVLINGSVLNLEPFFNETKAVLEMFYPGMECGNSVVDILTGESTPNGRLPFSWAKSQNDYPSIANGNYPGTRGENPQVAYDEGIFIGYRYMEREKKDLRFPFGFGLSYAKFEHELIEVAAIGNNSFCAKVKVSNVSEYTGASVVQLYVANEKNLPHRPFKVLRNFAKVHLNPNESKIVEIKLNARDFSHYDYDSKKIRLYDGSYQLLFGTSSQDIFASYDIKISK